MHWRTFVRRCHKLKEPFYISRVFFRPLSLPITYVFYHIGVSASIITLSSIMTGLAGVVALASQHALAAFLLIQSSFLLDHVDGNLARLSGSDSFAGAYLDQLGHLVVTPALFMALGIWSSAAHHAWIYLLYGIICSVSTSTAPLAARDRIVLSALDTVKDHRLDPAAQEMLSGKPWSRPGSAHGSRLEHFAATVLQEHVLFPGFLIYIPLSCLVESWVGLPVSTWLLRMYTLLTAFNVLRTAFRYWQSLRALDRLPSEE